MFWCGCRKNIKEDIHERLPPPQMAFEHHYVALAALGRNRFTAEQVRDIRQMGTIDVLYAVSANTTDDNEPPTRKDTTCFRCGERGHRKSECRTWKTKRCTNPVCIVATQCAFAHGDAELRTPWVARCVRVVRKNGQMVPIGCGKVGHTFKDCPHWDKSKPA